MVININQERIVGVYINGENISIYPLVYNHLLSYIALIASNVSILYWWNSENKKLLYLDILTSSTLCISYKVYQLLYIDYNVYINNILVYEILLYSSFLMNKYFQYKNNRLWILFHGFFHFFAGLLEYKVLSIYNTI